ncbi:MAG: ATP-binding protein [Candidatus Omnitrophota bacterium]
MRFLFHFFAYLAFLFFLSSNPCRSQESASNLGIFDATADWGTKESPLQRGRFKTPGRVEIRNATADAVYRIFGNGDDIWDNSDEGFFLYAERYGSWKLTARVKWLDRGGERTGGNNPSVHLMIRNQAKNSYSSQFGIYLRAGLEGPLGTTSATSWRTVDYGITKNIEHNAFLRGDAVNRFIFYRVSRISASNRLISEWSYDGSTWTEGCSMVIPMQDPVAYGIAITNTLDNELLASAQIDTIRLESIPFTSIRSLSKSIYQDQEPITVTIDVDPGRTNNVDAIAVENITPGFEVTNINLGGTIEDHRIVWKLDNIQNPMQLSYQIALLDNSAKGVFLFDGNVAGVNIGGEQFLYPQFGVFENVADWGTPQSPPRIGDYKTPGTVNVLDIEDIHTFQGDMAFTNLQEYLPYESMFPREEKPARGINRLFYVIEGSGDGFKDDSNEGFFIYSEKSGAWSLSAGIIDMNRDSDQDQRQIGLMIREAGDRPNAKFYFASFGSDNKFNMLNVSLLWRDASGFHVLAGSELSLSYYYNNNSALRVSCLREHGLCLAEVSNDGIVWTPIHALSLTFEQPLAYGIALASGSDDPKPIKAAVSRLKFDSLDWAPRFFQIADTFARREFKMLMALIIAIMFFTLALFAFVLFLFYSKLKENFYFAFLFLFMTISEIVWNIPSQALSDNFFSLHFLFIGITGCSLLAIVFNLYYLIYNVKFRQFLWTVVLLILILAALGFSFWFYKSGFLETKENYTYLETTNDFLLIAGTIISFEIVRLFLVGVWKRIHGMLLFGLGSMFYVGVYLWLAGGYFGYAGPLAYSFLLDGACILFSIVIFMLIAYRFAVSNRSLERLTAELEDRVERRTAELKAAQNQLIRSEKMSSLGQLIAGIAHEINNPVNFIKSNIQPLKDYLLGFKKAVDYMTENKEQLPSEMKERFEDIYEEEDLEFASQDAKKLMSSFEDGSDRISKIVADLRQYSRMDEDYYSQYDIHEAIDSTLNLLFNKYKNRIVLHKEYGDIPQISCSPGKINQVFMNIFVNAIEAIENEGHIWIQTSRQDKNAIIQIRDDGIGMPEEIKTKIFDPFFTTKPVGSGTGLGLSIVQGIIEQHGGTIAVESEAGKGTQFTVTLPLGENKA